MPVQARHRLPGQLGIVGLAQLIAQPEDGRLRRDLQSNELVCQHDQLGQFVIRWTGAAATISATPTRK